jgi:lysophospholipase L1-like esterase
MKTKYLLISLVFVALAIYLNRAYARIYSTIDQAHLLAPDKLGTYVIGDNKSSTSLTYVALGDSLTAGVGTTKYQESYPYLLTQKLAGNQTKLTLINLALPGFKTKDIINNSLKTTIADNPDIITLLIGVNDIHGNISKIAFQKNYQQILQELTTKTTAKIYVIGLPQIGSNQLLWFPYNYYFRWQIKNFNQVIKQLAIQYKLIYVNLDTPTAQVLKNNGPAYSIDSFHLSAFGYESWAQIIYANFNQ